MQWGEYRNKAVPMDNSAKVLELALNQSWDLSDNISEYYKRILNNEISLVRKYADNKIYIEIIPLLETRLRISDPKAPLNGIDAIEKGDKLFLVYLGQEKLDMKQTMAKNISANFQRASHTKQGAMYRFFYVLFYVEKLLSQYTSDHVSLIQDIFNAGEDLSVISSILFDEMIEMINDKNTAMGFFLIEIDKDKQIRLSA